MQRLPAYIETGRLTLRHWVADDAAALADAIAINLDHLRPWMPWIAHEPMSLDDRCDLFRKWHDDWEKSGDSVLGIFLDGTPVGSTGLHRRVGPRAAEIGYWIHKDHTRNGYAIEAAEAVTNAAFDLSDLDRIEIHHDKANTASAGIPRHLGFTMFEAADKESEAPGETGIEYKWAITRDEWRRRAGA